MKITSVAKNTTIYDIASRLGVSKTLVSFVLNGKSREMRISDEMTAKVLEMAEKLNYRPNYQARSLRTGKSNTIGLIVGDISNPFYARMARQVEIAAAKYGYQVIFSSSGESLESFEKQVDTLQNGQVDGLLVVPPPGSQKILLSMQKESVPFVVLDRFFNKVKAPMVLIDNHKASFDATNYLIAKQYKRISLFTWNNQLMHMKQRVKGYEDALVSGRIEPDPALIKILRFSHRSAGINRALEEVVASKADAIIFTTEKLGTPCISIIKSMGLSIPGDVAVISFDDSEAYNMSTPSISALRQPLEEICHRGMDILADMIDNTDSSHEYGRIEYKVQFIKRDSCK